MISFYKEFGELGYLASYSNYGFFANGVYYKTTEHYYQSNKVIDDKIKGKIIKASTPKIASEIGRDRNNKIKKLWRLIKCDVMYFGVLYKFQQNKDICQKLVLTGNEKIAEATVKENYWGLGKNNDGRNNYGIILELVRKKVRNDSMSYYTKEGFEKLEREIAQIDEEYVNTTLKMGVSDSLDSDLRENPEFMDLRVKAMYGLPALKAQLIKDKNNAIIIEDTEEYLNWDGESVSRKCKITILVDDDEEEEYTILGANEGNIKENILSCEAPLVLALLGHRVGEIVNYNGLNIQIESVKKIEKELTREL